MGDNTIASICYKTCILRMILRATGSRGAETQGQGTTCEQTRNTAGVNIVPGRHSAKREQGHGRSECG